MAGLQLPAPHLIAQANPGAWRVECVPTIKSAVDTHNRQAFLPESHMVEDILVQCHESEHIYRSSLPGCDVNTWDKRGAWWLQWRKMVEEVGVDASHAGRCGLSLTRRHDAYDWSGVPPPKDRDARGLMYLQMASHMVDTQNAEMRQYWETMLAQMPDKDKAALLAATVAIQHDYSPAQCDRITDALIRNHFPPPPPPTPPEPRRETSEAQDARADARDALSKAEKAADAAERKSGDADQTAEHLDRDAGEYIKRLGADGGAGGPGSTLLDVHKHTGAHMRPAQCGRTWRPTDVGAVVRYPMNYPNGAVFARRSRGGSIIMDWSGSMAWDWEELKAAIRACPALWCAGYSAHRDQGRTAYVGRLCILAEAGRLGTLEREKEHTGGNSGSDPASLAYMLACAQATPPYLWVSDGLVGSGFHKLTDSLCRKGGIVRVASLTDAIDMLMGRRVETFQGTPY